MSKNEYLAVQFPIAYVTADDVADVLGEMLPPFKRYAEDTPYTWDDQALVILERALANETTRDLLGRILGRDTSVPGDVLMLSEPQQEGVEHEHVTQLRNALLQGEREASQELRLMAQASDVGIGTIIQYLPEAIAIAKALIALWISTRPGDNSPGGGRNRRNRRNPALPAQDADGGPHGEDGSPTS